MHDQIAGPHAVADLRLALGDVAGSGRLDVLAREFDVILGEFGLGRRDVGMVGRGVSPPSRASKRLSVRPAFVHLGVERGELVHGVLQHLLRHRAARQRLVVARDVVPGLIAQRDLRGDLLAGSAPRGELRADRAHGARQLGRGLIERRLGALFVEPHDQLAGFHLVGFLDQHLARRRPSRRLGPE